MPDMPDITCTISKQADEAPEEVAPITVADAAAIAATAKLPDDLQELLREHAAFLDVTGASPSPPSLPPTNQTHRSAPTPCPAQFANE